MEEEGSVMKGSSQHKELQILETKGNSTMDSDHSSVVWIKEEPGCEEESRDKRGAVNMDGQNSSEVNSRERKRIRKETEPHSSSYVKEDTGVTGVSPTAFEDELNLFTKEEPIFKEETIDDWDMELEEVLDSGVTNRELKSTAEGLEPYSCSDEGTGCSNGSFEGRDAYRRFWTEFIQLYKENTCLWKVKSKEYSDRQKKTMAYGVLVEKLKEIDASANREKVAKKINSLRSAFKKEIRKVTSSRKSGATGDEVHQPNLWYYNLLLFLEDQEMPQELSSVSEELEGYSDARTSSKYDNEGLGECQSITSQSSSAMPEKPIGPSKPRKRGHPDTSDEAMTLIGDYLQSACLEDECSIIGRNVAAKLRRLSEEQRIFAERLINDVLFRGQLDNLNINTGIV